MKIEITRTSASKKGVVWLQAKVIEGETPRTGDVLECKESTAPKETVKANPAPGAS